MTIGERANPRRSRMVLGVVLAAGALSLWASFDLAEAATTPQVLSYEEGQAPGTYLRTVRFTGVALNKVKGATMFGPSPTTTPRSVIILLATRETLLLSLPAGLPQGDYNVLLRDRRSIEIAQAAVRLNLGSPAIGSIPASSISGPIDAATLGGLSSSAFLRTTGGTMTGAISFADGTGATRALLSSSVLRFSDPGGEKRLEAGVVSGSDAWWAVFDAAGNIRSEFSHIAQGDTTGLYFADTDGVYRGGLAEGLGAVGLVIVDSEGTPMVDLEGSDVWGFMTVTDFLGNSTTYGP